MGTGPRQVGLAVPHLVPHHVTHGCSPRHPTGGAAGKGVSMEQFCALPLPAGR
jgi:hypothetical protein